jgi:N-carbamoylputrescine amidase
MPKSETVIVGLVQMRCQLQPETNLEKAAAGIRRAASEGSRLVCLQELFRSPYFCQQQDPGFFDLAEPIPGPTTECLARLARETKTVIVAPIFERRAAGVYHNSAALIESNGSLAGIYRKMHIPDDPLYFEKYYFTPGDLGFPVFQTSVGPVGILICWDQWYPEAARLCALQGAQILFYPTAIGWHPREKAKHGAAQQQAWEMMQRSHAIANGLFVAAVNRVGHEGPSDAGLDFWGGSFVSDPFGRLLSKASTDNEEVLVVPCDLGQVEETRRNWPFLRDRRIDAYGGLSSRLIDFKGSGVRGQRPGNDPRTSTFGSGKSNPDVPDP